MANIMSWLFSFGYLKGGVIGEPCREISVEPKEEPIPQTAPAPTPEPVREPEPLTPA
jgi:hypothetical protein